MGVPFGEDVHIPLGSWYYLGSLTGDNWQRILLQSLTTSFSGLFHIGTMGTPMKAPMLIDKGLTCCINNTSMSWHLDILKEDWQCLTPIGARLYLPEVCHKI